MANMQRWKPGAGTARRVAQFERLLRQAREGLLGGRFALEKAQERLPYLLCRHNSLIRRRLGDLDMALQENKAVNLALAAPQVTEVLIRPGETFSFWHLVGSPSARKGYQAGLTLRAGKPETCVGGGLCQMTNLIHWMVLHSPLTVVEQHAHQPADFFPDYGRQIPFGLGTSVSYRDWDYRFLNATDCTFQLLVWTDEYYLRGELRSDKRLPVRYRITAEGDKFVRENGAVYRRGQVYRTCLDGNTGAVLFRELLRDNHARVLYDTSNLQIQRE